MVLVAYPPCVNPDPAVAAEVNALVSAWRGKAMTVVMALVATLGLPVTLLGMFSPGYQWPFLVCVVGLLAVLAAVLAVWRRDWSLPMRAGPFFLLAYPVAVSQLATTGLVGNGRLALLALPLLALILVGQRAGWIAFSASALTFVICIVLAGVGGPVGGTGIQHQSVDLTFWLVQGGLWLGLLVPLMVLLSRFQTLQMRLMIEERQARRENEIAERERRRLEEALTQLSDAEQRRLGAELHDGLCQQLTAALLACTALENELLARDLPQGPAARQVRRQLEESIGMAYDVAKGLCPVDLRPESLLPALQRLQAQAQKTPGVTCELHAASDASSLNPEATHHLYRIAQEAVQNALKHARCRRLALELSGSSAGLCLRIVDDGQPSAPTSPASPGGLGTQIMHYRAKAIGARLTVEHRPGGGTVVECHLPHPPETPPGAVP